MLSTEAELVGDYNLQSSKMISQTALHETLEDLGRGWQEVNGAELFHVR